MHYILALAFPDKLMLMLPIAFIVLIWVIMQWNNKLPSVDSIQQFAAIMNSRGGNIIILSLASVYFFRYSMYVFGHLLEMVRDKTISEDNAFALMAIQFVTTTAFGGAMGALLKTMTGETLPPTGGGTTSSAVTSSPEPPTPTPDNPPVVKPDVPPVTPKTVVLSK